MNCKKGDLAVVIGTSPFAGMIVEIIDRAPNEPFILPNGQPHATPSHPESWIVKMPREVPAWVYGELTPRMTEWGVGPDRALRPIRNKPGEDETLTWAPVPHKETA